MIFGRYKYGVFVGLLGWVTIVSAAVPVFIPERGAIVQDTWETESVGGIFQNPAQLLTGLSRTIVRVDGSQDGLGYSQASVGCRMKWSDIALGVGYSRYGSQDLVRTARNSTTARIEEAGNFGDPIQQFSVVAATEISPVFQIGVDVDAISKTIDTSTATQLGIGVGLRYLMASDVWATGYWRRALQSHFEWGTLEESSPGAPSVGVEYRPSFATIVGYLDLADGGARLAGEFPVSLELSLTGALITGASERYSVGTILKLGDYALQYIHTVYADSVLGANQEMIGVAINIDDFTK
jgi:hypothetical protein